MFKFGPVGFFLNQIPHMDLPWILAIFLKPMILLIELVGLTIKHAVLSVRLLANMVAGHVVLLGLGVFQHLSTYAEKRADEPSEPGLDAS